jgi:hypothetical protein
MHIVLIIIFIFVSTPAVAVKLIEPMIKPKDEVTATVSIN